MPGVVDGLVQQPERLVRARDRRRVPALVAGVEGALAVALEQDLGEGEVDLGRDLQRLEDRPGADRDDDELLEVEVVGGVLAAVDQVDQRHREHVAVAAQMAEQRGPGGVGGGSGRGERDAEQGVGAEPSLVRGAVDRRPARRRAPAGSRRRSRTARAASSPLTASTAPSTPKPPKRSPPSRSSTASLEPVERPDGTSARPRAPQASSTSTCTVGRPRQSRTSRALIEMISRPLSSLIRSPPLARSALGSGCRWPRPGGRGSASRRASRPRRRAPPAGRGAPGRPRRDGRNAA